MKKDSAEEEFLYFTAGEKSIYNNAFNDIFDFSNNSNFYDKFMKLTYRLDAESKHCLVKCLSLIQRLKMCDTETMDIFTEEERNELLLRRNRLEKGIVRLSDNLWEYCGYILPVRDFRAEIFEDRIGVETIENKKAIYGKDIIDVGAYVGDSSLILSELTDGSVYAIEPINKNIEHIEITAKINQKKIIPINAAAADTDSIGSLAIGERIYNSSIERLGSRRYVDTVDTKTMTIDQFVRKNKLDIGLIKIHAEGAEQKVLLGAKETIATQAPVIIVEINHTESDFYDIKPILEEWQKRYRFRVYKPNNGLICLGLKLIAYI